MALVVTARPPVDAQSSPYASRTARLNRLGRALPWLATGGAAWYGLGLVTESLARLNPPSDVGLGLAASEVPRLASASDVLALAAPAVTAGAVAATLGMCIVAWLSR